jgi:hypothetical protein
MRFQFAHDRTWPHPDSRNFRVMGQHYLCGMSGCAYYLDLLPTVREWFKESGVEYKIEGTDAWGEGFSGKLFELEIPNPSHATLFKLRWL